jgi:hypothetical protein
MRRNFAFPFAPTLGKNQGDLMNYKGLAGLMAALSLFLVAGSVLADAPTAGWLDRHDGGLGGDETGTMLLACPDGDLITGGESRKSDGAATLYIRRLDRDTGATMWEYNFSYPDKDVSVTGLTWANSGQLLVAGYVHGCIG